MATAARQKASAEAPERFLNRELSWLDFNARVLELAADPALPLLERLRFCSRFSTHLDEFFAVRVSGLIGQALSGLAVKSPDGRTPEQALAEIRQRVLAASAEQARLWKRELRPALEEEGILIGRISDCSDKELEELAKAFEREIYPVLTPLAVGPGQPFPYISALSLSLGVFVRDPKTAEERFARVKVPELLPRFIRVGKRQLYLPLEHVITYSLSSLFPKMEITECGPFRVTRDADFEVSDEADDLLEAVELELRRRRFGGTVRLEVSESMSDEMLTRIRAGLGASEDQVYRIEGLLDLADVDQLVDIDRPDLKDEPWRPITQPRLAVPTTDAELFDEIRRSDIFVHLPYESFATSVEAFVQAAARDPDVIAIKTTVYRTSDESPLVPALIEAAESGKQSVCLVELKARFDERRNIEWSRALERSGVHVVYGFPSLKTHAKMTLVVRREAHGLQRYVHVGTGNYHALTARGYEDFGLFTTDEKIAGDVADLFNHLTGFGRPQRFRSLLVAPFSLRTTLVDEIRAVSQAAKAGKTARIRVKANALTDESVIDALYDASDAGAEIDVLTRSICSLRPGVKGLSENIRVRSVVGRFLEHSRVFVFEAGGKTTYFMGSADLMPRNLDNRLEVVVPVDDSRARQRINAMFDALLSDNTNSWELNGDGTWDRVPQKKDDRAVSAQGLMMRSAIARARRTVARRS
jgi:polyphosphate kinase